MAAGVGGEPIGVGFKDPDTTRPFKIDWGAKRLASGVAINGSTWAVSSTGLTITSSTYSTSDTTAVVSGGTGGQTYQLINRVSLDDSTTDELTIWVKVKER